MDALKKISNIDDLEALSLQMREFYFFNCSRVLLCVQDFMAQKSITNVVQGGGAKDVRTMKNASEIMEAIKDYPGPVLVFYDIQFPVLGILDFLKQLKASKQEANVRLVLLSSVKLSDAHIKQFRNFGVNGFLTIPLVSDDISRTLIELKGSV